MVVPTFSYMFHFRICCVTFSVEQTNMSSALTNVRVCACVCVRVRIDKRACVCACVWLHSDLMFVFTSE